MDKRKVVFRADGGEAIGMGHFIRTLALVEMLKDDFCCVFVTQLPSVYQKNEIERIGCEHVYLPNSENSFDIFIDFLEGDEIVVLDNYYFTIDHQLLVKLKGCKLVCIDDLHDKNFVADLIVNHAPGVLSQDYKALPYTQYALGLDYALLRPLFLEEAKIERKIDKIQTLLICFGGSDFKNLTKSTLKVALAFSEFSKIIVITGSAYQITTEFIKLVNSDKRVEHRSNLSEQEMLSAMLEAEIAIVPASGILLESIAVGCIVLSGIYIENQRFIYDNLVKRGLVVDCQNFEPDKIFTSLYNILRRDKRKQTRLIDGQTNIRLNKIFRRIDNEFFAKTRRANISDLDLTYSWATDPIIRQFSFNKHVISYNEHTIWFLNKLNDLYCFYFILEYKDKTIGSIRFDISNNEALISYLLDPLYHGQDLGLLLLKIGIKSFINEVNFNVTPFNELSGYVLKENIPSIKAFEKLGFMKTENEEILKFRKQI